MQRVGIMKIHCQALAWATTLLGWPRREAGEPGWRGNGEGSQEGWKGGRGGDASQLSCLCSAVAAVPEGCWEEAQLLLLLVLWG